VIGVAKDVLFGGLTDPSHDVVYRPLKAMSGLNLILLVRSSGRTADIPARVRRAAAAIDPALPITRQFTMNEVINEQIGPQWIFAWTSGMLAVLGFILAAVGIYGLMAQAAAERTREFGIRVALGAEQRAIRWLVLKSALIIVTIGAPLGVALAAIASRLVTNQLFGVTAADPAVYALAAVALGAIAIGSGAVPAWMASRANPADVMRVE
jgi:predicted lysophospholipase L1 biosynthesis ABC-type transport system permease subunit